MGCIKRYLEINTPTNELLLGGVMWQLRGWAGRGGGGGSVHLQHCRDLETLTAAHWLLWGFFGGFFGLEWLLLTLFFVCVWMSAWYCKSLEHNLLKNASLPNLTNKSSSCPTSRLGCFLLLLGGSRVKRWPRQSVCSDLRSAWDNAKKSCILGTLSDSWFTSAPYCFTPVPLEFFPGVSQGEGGCRAGPDSWVVFLANSRALPSLPELRLWAGVFCTTCVQSLSFSAFPLCCGEHKRILIRK